MEQETQSAKLTDKLSDVLDWAVLGVGALSLAIAVAATVVQKTELFSANQATPAAADAAG